MIKDHPPRQHKQEVTLRDAKEADAVMIARLLHELAAGEQRHCLQTEQTVVHDLLGKGSCMRVLVAGTHTEVVGVLCYYPGYDIESASHGNHLADIIVSKAWRGCGVGTKLMQEAARRTLEEGGQWLSWTALKHNRKAIAFYKAHGAQTIGLTFMAMGAGGLKALAEKQPNQ